MDKSFANRELCTAFRHMLPLVIKRFKETLSDSKDECDFEIMSNCYGLTEIEFNYYGISNIWLKLTLEAGFIVRLYAILEYFPLNGRPLKKKYKEILRCILDDFSEEMENINEKANLFGDYIYDFIVDPHDPGMFYF